ncbi:hypothetical protein EJ110_NYTH03555 [Nymphaea thermarum]|nr:hypothetical protein EJ110_NYTH03555 [Nymphaea thermarum]
MAFRLTNVGRTLVVDDQGVLLGAYVLQHHQDALVQGWTHLHEAVLDSSEAAFKKAHRVAAYEYYGKDLTYNSVMLRTMAGVCLVMIVERYPGLHGINFGLPEVVDNAPQYHEAYPPLLPPPDGY